ncbi:uncharacterized protein [Triticum aestivum]|uniref:uncharacterized protein n=1 Tax=Triticum aestivum TaxID=4565 RepID=UPI001D01C9D2|nr:uncharacterized protein LOC123066289 [Triticum aestivum]
MAGSGQRPPNCRRTPRRWRDPAATGPQRGPLHRIRRPLPPYDHYRSSSVQSSSTSLSRTCPASHCCPSLPSSGRGRWRSSDPASTAPGSTGFVDPPRVFPSQPHLADPTSFVAGAGALALPKPTSFSPLPRGLDSVLRPHHQIRPGEAEGLRAATTGHTRPPPPRRGAPGHHRRRRALDFPTGCTLTSGLGHEHRGGRRSSPIGCRSQPASIWFPSPSMSSSLFATASPDGCSSFEYVLKLTEYFLQFIVKIHGEVHFFLDAVRLVDAAHLKK